MSNQKAPIIKKVKKVVGGGAHGGAWKVAYADFVTAMMAFFLLMWLLNMSSPEKRVRLSYYFKHFSIFQSGGTSIMAKSSEMFSESGQTTQKVFKDTPTDKNKVSNKDEEATLSEQISLSNNRKTGSADKSTPGDRSNDLNVIISKDSGAGYLEGIEKALKQIIMDNLGDIKDQVLVDTVEDGVRIQMIDKEGSEMFVVGSNRLTTKAKDVLHVIGGNINKLPNKVIIEGHTDSLPYTGNQYSNWELSTERASSARRELETIGLDPERIIRVAGYADTEPLISENPADPRNRRISITLKIPLTEKKDQTDNEMREKKDELNAAMKKDQKLPALIIPGKPPFSKKVEIPSTIKTDDLIINQVKPSPRTEKEIEKAAKDTGWGPVIQKTRDPVMQAPLNLSRTNREMIKNDWVPKSLHTDKPEGKNTEKQAGTKKVIKTDPAKESIKSVSKPLKKLPPLLKPGDHQDVTQTSDKEQWNPVVKDNTWNPVLKKNEWSPVLDNN